MGWGGVHVLAMIPVGVKFVGPSGGFGFFVMPCHALEMELKASERESSRVASGAFLDSTDDEEDSATCRDSSDWFFLHPERDIRDEFLKSKSGC